MLTRTGRPGGFIYLSLVLLVIFCWIEVDLYAPSFPRIRQHFGTTEAMIQWTLSINFMGYFVSSLAVGPLADSYGRRPVLLGGCFLFIAGSLVAFLAPNLPMLLAGRLLQGVGVSGPTIVALAVIGDLFHGDRQVKLFSVMNSLITLTMAAAPILGAWLSERFGWRSNFALILAGACLVGRVDARRMALASLGAAVLGVSGLLLHALWLPDSAHGITLLMCVYVAGVVWPCGCIFAAIFEAFPDLKGSASALFGAARMLVMAAAIALSGHLYDATFRSVAWLMAGATAAGAGLVLAAQRGSGYRVGREGAGGH